MPDTKKTMFRFHYGPILIDNLIRWGLLALWSRHLLPTIVFWILQIVVLPLAVGIVMLVRWDDAVKRAKTTGLLSEVDLGTASITVLVLIWIIGTYVGYTSIDFSVPWTEIVAAVAISLAYAAYVALIANLSAGRQILNAAEPPLTFQHIQDENDKTIASLETERAVLFQRVDTYTLEATLLGAISFSAFVSIVASDRQIATGIEPLISCLEGVLGDILAGRISVAHAEAIVGDKAEIALLAAIAVETLICAAFFLSVLIARIRFMYAIRWSDYSIRLASMMNAKEEDVFNLTLTVPEGTLSGCRARLDEIRENIKEAIANAETSLSKLRPLIMYMAVFRNLGLLSFLVTLVTGALWFSRTLSVAFAALCLFAFIYPYLDTFRDKAYGRLAFFGRHSHAAAVALGRGKARG